MIKFLYNLPKNIAIAMVMAYQATLSPDHSWLKARFPHGYCKFYPSCSEYSKQAFIAHGFVKGFYLSLKRIIKCHPWAESKVDTVPEKF
jgi:putative membrane protein insertion efficiency factor